MLQSCRAARHLSVGSGCELVCVDPEIHGQPRQFRHRADLELVKDAGPVQLDRSFGDLKVGGDLLVDLSI